MDWAALAKQWIAQREDGGGGGEKAEKPPLELADTSHPPPLLDTPTNGMHMTGTARIFFLFVSKNDNNFEQAQCFESYFIVPSSTANS